MNCEFRQTEQQSLSNITFHGNSHETITEKEQIMKDSKKRAGFNGKQFAIWLLALVLGGILGTLNIGWLNEFFNFIASVYTRLFQFVSVPTMA